jgi:hypothetical protein
VWANLAPKYGRRPDEDPEQIVPEFIRTNPGLLGPQMSGAVLKDFLAPGQGSNMPSAIQVYEYRAGLNPEQRGEFDLTQRAPQFQNLGGAPNIIIGGAAAPLSTPEAEAEAKRRQAAASAEGKTEGERTAARPKVLASYQSTQSKTQNVVSAISRARQQATAMTTGFAGARTKGIEGTPSYDLAQTVNTIKANIGFRELQEMRDNSPTGGALGQVSEREIDFLNSVIANIEQGQSREQFLRNLDTIEAAWNGSLVRLREAYRRDYGAHPEDDANAPSLFAQPPPQQGGGLDQMFPPR